MINVLQAMILTEREKMVPTPTYYVFKLYAPFQDSRFVPIAFNPGTYVHGDITLLGVDAITATEAVAELWLAITNLDPNQSVEVEASLAGITAKSASGEILTRPKVESINSFEAPITVVPKAISPMVQGGKLTLKLEPKSVTVVSVEQ